MAGAGPGAVSGGSPHAGKFKIAVALLVGVALGAITIAVGVLATGRSSNRASFQWSSWQPQDSGLAGAREIAERLAPLYRISQSDQLAIVTVVNVASAAQTAASQNGTSTTAASGLEVAVQQGTPTSVSLLSGNTIAYNLCGIGGSNCSIGVGTPSAARLLLLRREAFELALYTFKYLSDSQNVVAILPPGHTMPQSRLVNTFPSGGTAPKATPVDVAVLFSREELSPFLAQPLAATLPEEFPPTVSQMATAAEAELVDVVTAHGLFSERIETAQDGSSLLVLNPLPPQ